jgi:hypothetical protein
MKTVFIGTTQCARCHGDDPNCYVCQEVEKKEVPPAEVDDDDPDDNEEAYPDPDECFKSSAYERALDRADYLHDEMKDRETNY